MAGPSGRERPQLVSARYDGLQWISHLVARTGREWEIREARGPIPAFDGTDSYAVGPTYPDARMAALAADLLAELNAPGEDGFVPDTLRERVVSRAVAEPAAAPELPPPDERSAAPARRHEAVRRALAGSTLRPS